MIPWFGKFVPHSLVCMRLAHLILIRNASGIFLDFTGLVGVAFTYIYTLVFISIIRPHFWYFSCFLFNFSLQALCPNSLEVILCCIFYSPLPSPYSLLNHMSIMSFLTAWTCV